MGGVAPGEGAAALADADVARALRLGAEQGDPVAQFKLGCMYFHGHGVPQDYAHALSWYCTAADNGHPDAHARVQVLCEAVVGEH